MMIGKGAVQSQIRDAIEEAKGYLEALEQLLKEAQEKGGVTTPESLDKISEAKLHCKEAMERFVIVYRAYCDLSSSEARGESSGLVAPLN